MISKNQIYSADTGILLLYNITDNIMRSIILCTNWMSPVHLQETLLDLVIKHNIVSHWLNSRIKATTAASSCTSLLLVSQTLQALSQDCHQKLPLLLLRLLLLLLILFVVFSSHSCPFSPIWIKTERRITNAFWAERKGDEFGVLNRQAKPIT